MKSFRKTSFLAAVVAMAALGGCASSTQAPGTGAVIGGTGIGSSYRPPAQALDPRVQAALKFDQDLLFCQAEGRKVANLTMDAMLGVAEGAIVGTAVGAIANGKVVDGTLTALGAVVGASRRFVVAERAQRNEVVRCLYAKGYVFQSSH